MTPDKHAELMCELMADAVWRICHYKGTTYSTCKQDLKEVLQNNVGNYISQAVKYRRISEEKLFESIKHGDQEHQDWLKGKIKEFYEDA